MEKWVTGTAECGLEHGIVSHAIHSGSFNSAFATFNTGETFSDCFVKCYLFLFLLPPF